VNPCSVRVGAEGSASGVVIPLTTINAGGDASEIVSTFSEDQDASACTPDRLYAEFKPRQSTTFIEQEGNGSLKDLLLMSRVTDQVSTEVIGGSRAK
jgi:hypothetical protein